MTVITIRNVPDDLNERLKAKARARGQSLQQFLLRELVDVADRSPVEVRLREVLGPLTPVDVSADEVRAALEMAQRERDSRADATVASAHQHL